MYREKNWELPDPFGKEDGSRIGSKEEWEEQKQYFKRMLEEQFYGKMPPKPEEVKEEKRETTVIQEGQVFYEKVRLVTGVNDGVKFTVHVYRPGTEGKKICVVIPAGNRLDENLMQMAIAQDIVVASYEIKEAAPDDREKWNCGGCGRTYPEYTWRALAMWAWLASRVIDWLENQDFADTQKFVVTGHSRMGKMAMCCGIYDDRVAVTAPAGSGCGGMASLRLNGSRLGEGIGRAERIGVMLGKENFYYWLLDSVAEYGTADGLTRYRENELPFDANILGACIAPRGLILMEGLDDNWINPYGTQTAWLATAEVYRFLGISDKCGIHYREGGHEYNREDWSIMLDFCQTVLKGQPKRTNYKIMQEDTIKSGYSWTIPSL